MVHNICKNGIVNEDEWDESDWYNAMAARRSFFTVSRKKTEGLADDSVLERVFFWSMPHKDIEAAEVFWRNTRDKVRAGDYTHFIRFIEHSICHVRPKAKDAADTTDTPQGGKTKKSCYWLNRDYDLESVKEHLWK